MSGKKSRFYSTPAFLLFISTCLYFSPALFGSFEMTWSSGSYISVVYSIETIITSACIVLILAAVAFFWPRNIIKYQVFRGEHLEAKFLLWLIILLMVYTFMTPALFSVSKFEVLESTNRLHSLFYNLCVIGLIFCFLTNWKNHKVLMLASVLGLLLALYIGHRSYLIISVVGLIYINYRSKSMLSMEKSKILISVAILFVMMIYKPIYSAIKDGNIELILYRLMPENILVSLAIGAEQFVTYTILDQVVNSDYRLPCSNIWFAPLTIIPFTENIINLKDCTFNGQFQGTYFSDLSGGIAANIWGEFIANFGIIGVPIFIFLSIGICSAIERFTMIIRSPVLISGLIVMIIQLTFYIQRNEFLTGFTLGKRAVIASLIIFSMIVIIKKSGVSKIKNYRKI